MKPACFPRIFPGFSSESAAAVPSFPVKKDQMGLRISNRKLHKILFSRQKPELQFFLRPLFFPAETALGACNSAVMKKPCQSQLVKLLFFQTRTLAHPHCKIGGLFRMDFRQRMPFALHMVQSLRKTVQKFKKTELHISRLLFYKGIDGLIQLPQAFFIPIFNGFHNTVGNVFF